MKKIKLPKINFSSPRLKSLSNKIFQNKAEKILLELLDLEKENPDDARIKQKVAEIYYQKNQIDNAIQKYREIVEYNEQKDFVLKAIKACKSILKIKPALIPYNIKLAALYIKQGMTNEAANQYRIAINHYANAGDLEKTVSLSQDLVKIDPSNDNRAKLAEIYQNAGMTQEAVSQYEILAKYYRANKDYEKLLFYYELILPHKPDNKAILKDICILHLRNQKPDRALKIINHYKVSEDPLFADLQTKAALMTEALRKHK
ncbi:MAG: hypothetical protein HQM16_18590 [Deltaproteobacteria bacterium]|nr:hypothetical protein [Deltaproteobacteria bacterium]